jgi:hypothetical protein
LVLKNVKNLERKKFTFTVKNSIAILNYYNHTAFISKCVKLFTFLSSKLERFSLLFNSGLVKQLNVAFVLKVTF